MKSNEKARIFMCFRKKLTGLPKEDIDERLSFYSEMIDDRMEEGLTEKEAVLEIGDVDDIYTQIIADIPFSKLVKERIKPKRNFKVWEIVLLILASPIWVSLIIAAISVIIAIYVALWSLIIALWAIFAALVVCSVASYFYCLTNIIDGKIIVGLAILGLGLMSAGCSALIFNGSKFATFSIIKLTKKMIIKLKRSFIKKEEN